MSTLTYEELETRFGKIWDIVTEDKFIESLKDDRLNAYEELMNHCFKLSSDFDEKYPNKDVIVQQIELIEEQFRELSK
jgi:hypothetical protein